MSWSCTVDSGESDFQIFARNLPLAGVAAVQDTHETSAAETASMSSLIFIHNVSVCSVEKFDFFATFLFLHAHISCRHHHDKHAQHSCPPFPCRHKHRLSLLLTTPYTGLMEQFSLMHLVLESRHRPRCVSLHALKAFQENVLLIDGTLVVLRQSSPYEIKVERYAGKSKSSGWPWCLSSRFMSLPEE